MRHPQTLDSLNTDRWQTLDIKSLENIIKDLNHLYLIWKPADSRQGKRMRESIIKKTDLALQLILHKRIEALITEK